VIYAYIHLNRDENSFLQPFGKLIKKILFMDKFLRSYPRFSTKFKECNKLKRLKVRGQNGDWIQVKLELKSLAQKGSNRSKSTFHPENRVWFVIHHSPFLCPLHTHSISFFCQTLPLPFRPILRCSPRRCPPRYAKQEKKDNSQVTARSFANSHLTCVTSRVALRFGAMPLLAFVIESARWIRFLL